MLGVGLGGVFLCTPCELGYVGQRATSLLNQERHLASYVGALGCWQASIRAAMVLILLLLRQKFVKRLRFDVN